MIDGPKPLQVTKWSADRIVAGDKRETRRPLKIQPTPEPWRFFPWNEEEGLWAPESRTCKMFLDESWQAQQSPYGLPGDIRYLKVGRYGSRAKSPADVRIEDVKVQRLQDISLMECVLEGIRVDALQESDSPLMKSYTMAALATREFMKLWDGIYTPNKGWEVNLWVWVIRLAVVTVRSGVD